MADTWNKKEREKKRQQAKKEKAEKKLERKENNSKGKGLEDMMAYIDEYGNISSTPPDPRKKIKVKAEDIEISIPKQQDTDPADLLRRGVITFFNESKGYGFIRDSATQESIFVHINSLLTEVQEKSKVIFEVEKGPKGLNAVNVRKEE
ncbi:MAG TPA: cold shock domain-containing protein [Chitinophagaceae bacterium]|nr:cold shock domain-containing protein [Chitinophagaceae bacterium]